MVHTVLDPLFKANTKGIRNLQTSLHRALPDNKFPLLDFMSCIFGIVEGESVERSDHSCVYKWWWKVLATDIGVLDMERQATKRRVRMFFEWVDSDDYDGYLPKLSRQRYDEMTQCVPLSLPFPATCARLTCPSLSRRLKTALGSSSSPLSDSLAYFDDS